MVTGEISISAMMVAAFAAIHIFIGRLRFVDITPRSRWLSFAGGVAVAYVFLHVLPDLGAHSEQFAQETGYDPVVAESLVYALALAGLATFYGLERAIQVSRAISREEGDRDVPQADALWLHIVSYGLLNLLVGYLLLHREEGGALGLWLYFGAMALHFFTADFGMRKHHLEAYDHTARWMLALAVTLGWVIGLAVTLPPVVVGGLFAFLAGGIVLNVLKEELPEERQSYFLPFLAGTLVYAGMALIGRIAA